MSRDISWRWGFFEVFRWRLPAEPRRWAGECGVPERCGDRPVPAMRARPRSGRAEEENPESEMGAWRRQNPRQSGARRGEQRGKGGVGTPGSLERGSLETGVWKNQPVFTKETEELCHLIRTKGESPLGRTPMGTFLTFWRLQPPYILNFWPHIALFVSPLPEVQPAPNNYCIFR